MRAFRELVGVFLIGACTFYAPALLASTALVASAKVDSTTLHEQNKKTALELYVVDTSLPDWELLVANLPADAQVYTLDSDKAFFEHLAIIAARYRNLTAIHILSHGDAGEIHFSNQHFGVDDFVEHKSVLSALGASLIKGGDILLYGCFSGQSSKGLNFVQQIANLTNGDVAASTDATGFGQNWKLETQSGEIESKAIEVGNWKHQLWSGAADAAGWWGDTPPLTPNATNIGAGFTRYTTIGPSTGGPGVTFNIFSTGAASVEQSLLVNSTSLAAAITNNDYYYTTLVVGSVGQRISAMSFNQVTNNIAAARMAVVLRDTVTGTNQTLGTDIVIDGASTTVPISLAAHSLIPGRTYELRRYYFRSTGTTTFTAYSDNNKFTTENNDVPTAFNDSFTHNASGALTGTLTANNGNGADSDVESDTLTVTNINGGTFTVGSAIGLSAGSLTINNAVGGLFSFTPNGSYGGLQTFTYTINDGMGNNSTATATITSPINASNDNFSTPSVGPGVATAASVFSNDSFLGATLNGSSVTATIINNGGMSGVTINANGTIGIPANTLAGTYNVTYQVCHNNLLTNCASATVTVVVHIPSLSIVKSYSFDLDSGEAGKADLGDILRYNYVVRNTGSLPLTNVSVADTIHNHSGPFATTPTGAVLTDNTPSGDSSGTAGGPIWATLAPNDEVTFTSLYTVTQTDVDTLQ